MFKILKHLKLKQWILILISIVLIVVQVWLDLKLPDYMKAITELLTSTEADKIAEIWKNGGLMIACALGSLASAVAVGFLMSKVAASFSLNLRFKMFDRIGDFASDEINKFSTESLITRTTNDVTQVQQFITMGAQLLIKAPILAVWAIIKISTKSNEWMLATLVTILLITVLIGFIMIFVIPKFRKIQKVTDNLTAATRESLTGVRVVRAYNAESYQEDKFEKVNEELTGINLFTSRGMSIMGPSMNFLLSVLSISIYIIGAVLINNLTNDNPIALLLERMDLFSDMAVFSQYAMQVIMAYMMLIMIFILLPRASVSAKRINEVLGTNPSINDGNGDTNTELDGQVEFKNVSFKYPDAEEYVLRDVSFTANKGETVAFIGSTGSGKSTLINLVPRFYDVTDGVILIDGIDIRDYKLNELNNKLGYVPQKSVLFKGTIASNIRYGETNDLELTDKEIWKALEVAQGKDFVEKTELQLEHAVAQSGSNLSGGQKQRVAIARAIARQPEILIFDDSFSALDYKTDRVLRTSLKKNFKGITNLIVAQRIGTIIDADKIVVLDKGKIVGIGKHHELLKTCDVYKEIAHSQLTEEELA